MEVLEGEVTSHEDVTRGRIRVTSANEQAILTAVDRIETLLNGLTQKVGKLEGQIGGNDKFCGDCKGAIDKNFAILYAKADESTTWRAAHDACGKALDASSCKSYDRTNLIMQIIMAAALVIDAGAHFIEK